MVKVSVEEGYFKIDDHRFPIEVDDVSCVEIPYSVAKNIMLSQIPEDFEILIYNKKEGEIVELLDIGEIYVGRDYVRIEIHEYRKYWYLEIPIDKYTRALARYYIDNGYDIELYDDDPHFHLQIYKHIPTEKTIEEIINEILKIHQEFNEKVKQVSEEINTIIEKHLGNLNTID